MGPGVPSGHPSEEFPVVDDKVGKGELMRVEEEWRDGERKHGDPEVNEVVGPDSQRDEQEQDEGSHAEVDGRSSES